MSGSIGQVAPPLLLIGTKRDSGVAAGAVTGGMRSSMQTATLSNGASLASEAEACLTRWRSMFAEAGAAVSFSEQNVLHVHITSLRFEYFSIARFISLVLFLFLPFLPSSLAQNKGGPDDLP
jgi:hypothetical protein